MEDIVDTARLGHLPPAVHRLPLAAVIGPERVFRSWCSNTVALAVYYCSGGILFLKTNIPVVWAHGVDLWRTDGHCSYQFGCFQILLEQGQCMVRKKSKRLDTSCRSSRVTPSPMFSPSGGALSNKKVIPISLTALSTGWCCGAPPPPAYGSREPFSDSP